MKTKTFTCILFFAYLACVTPVVAVAGQAANAYVTVESDKGDITLSGDGMNFHLSPADGPVTISVKANHPYILDTPKNSVTIKPHDNVIWAVHSEDGESNIKTASGSIDFCNYKLIGSDTKHDDTPQFAFNLAINVSPETRIPNTRASFTATVDVLNGWHKVFSLYIPCPCGYTPDPSQKIAWTFNRYHWSLSFPNSDINTILGDSLEPKFSVNMLMQQWPSEVYVIAEGTNTECHENKCYGRTETNAAL